MGSNHQTTNSELQIILTNIEDLSQAGWRGGGGAVRPPSQILADQLTLSQQGGLIMLTTLLRATPDFQTL